MEPLTFTIRRYDSLPSTQRTLMEMAGREEVAEGTVILARFQTDGTGQPGNRWHSDPGKNLTFSLLLRPDFLPPAHQFLLNKMVSLAILQILKDTGEIPAPLSVKWPNDIWAGDRKIAGILVSNAIMGDRISYSVVGIGLNVNQGTFPSECPNPTSLLLETGLATDTGTLLPALLDVIAAYYTMLARAPEQIDGLYLASLYRLGVEAPYMVHGRRVTGKITGVDEYGKLLLGIQNGETLRLDLKEIVYIF